MTTESETDEEVTFEPGDFCRDSVEDNKLCLVLEVTDTPAGEYRLDVLGGKAISNLRRNREFSKETPVVVVAYSDDLSDKLGSSWRASEVVELYEETGFEDLTLRDYAMPKARLNPHSAEE